MRACKPEIGVYQPAGRFTLEAYAGAWFFTANHDYFPGTAVKRQDPLVALRSHTAYAATRRVWLSLDTTSFSGCQRSPKLPHLWSSKILTLGSGRRFDGQQSLKLSYHTGATTFRGSDYDTFTLTWQVMWLGGAPRP